MGLVPLATYVAIGRTAEGRPVCSCREGADCKNAGKHPIGRYADIDTPDKGYAQVWSAVKNETAKGHPVNLAVRAGVMSGIFVVDLDIKEGQNGVEQFKRWLEHNDLSFEDLQKTLCARSGGGGMHLVFKHPKGVELSPKNSDKVFGKGVDIKAGGSPFHVAPSVHKYGGLYQWTNWVEPIESPEKIWRVAQRQQAPSFNADESYTPSTSEVREYADELSRTKKEHAREVGKNLKAAMDGEIVARDGGGHDAFRDIAFFLLKKWPTASAETLCQYLEPAINVRLEEMPDSSTSLEDVMHAFSSAQGKVEEQKKNWSSQVATNNEGKPIVSDANMLLFFRNHPAWQGVFGYNERRNRSVYLRRPPLSREVRPGDIELSRDKSEMALWFQHKGQMAGRFNTKDLLDAINGVAHDRAFDPLKDQILQLRGTWDGVRRLEHAAQHVMGAPDTAWTRTVFPLWMKSLVMRITQPGCKVDTMLILEGLTGYKKSTFFEALLPDPMYFSDSLKRVSHDVEAVRLVHSGPAIFEIGELSALRKTDVEDVKAFLSSRKDDLRPLYETFRVALRRCVFVGTTNQDRYLRDETGNRRFWPVLVTQRIDVDLVVRDRLMWFAEALARLEQGEAWWLSQEEEKLASAEQETRMEDDIWEERIIQWLSARSPDAAVVSGAIEYPNGVVNGFVYSGPQPQSSIVYSGKPSDSAKEGVVYSQSQPVNGLNNAPTSQMQAEVNKQMAGDVVTVAQVAQYALQIELKNARSSEGHRITKIMKQLKWHSIRLHVGNNKYIRAWKRPYSNQA